MQSITWAPGSNSELDELFDNLRHLQFNNKSHRLWKNYDTDIYNMSVALTIHWDDDGRPELCSTIAKRDCWPENTYRILNRMWKVSEKKKRYLRRVSNCVGLSAKSQIEWLANNCNYDLVFCSRQTLNWEEWTIKNFKEYFSLEFKTDNYKYLTCENECDYTCWQKIIYHGNEGVLNQWKRHQ